MPPAALPLRRLAVAALAAAACSASPKLEPKPASPLPAEAQPAITLESATVTPASCLAGGSSCRVIVTYRLDDRGTPITGDAAAALAPRWTLAALGTEPESGLPAWESLVLTGAQIIPSLLTAGPGTSAPPLLGQRQPGSESTGVTTPLGDGRFTYTFTDALTVPLGTTLRVGVFLDGAPGAARTCGTLDFVPDGGAVQAWGSVSDDLCNRCHGLKLAHDGRRTGVKLCLTCHTWRNADPDTVDAAAMSLGADTSDPATLAARAMATRATYPNPLELGRFIHRIHRGASLPTLYRSAACYTSSTKAGVTQLASTSSVLCNVTTLPPTFPASAAPAAPPPPPDDLPWTVPALPFRSGRNALGPIGLKASVLGDGGAALVIGSIQSRSTNGQAAVTSAEGIVFPHDLRHCGACHADESSTGPTVTAISRRTCSGCHPDVWFGAVTRPATDPAPDLDAFHLPHSGGPQADDSACAGCHVTHSGYRWAPIAEFHSPPLVSPRWKKPSFAIVDVQGLAPGTPGTPGTPGPATATIRFKAWDGSGTLTPLNAPTPAWDADPASPSPVPRKLTSLTFRLGGPNTDYVTGGGHETVTGTTSPSYTRTFSYAVASGTTATLPWSATCTNNASGLLALSADGAGVFTCTFPNPFASLNLTPGQVDVQGTWTLMAEGRRASTATQYAIPAPYTCTTTTGCAAGTYPNANWPWYGWNLAYDYLTDTFRWPGTGETVTEAADNVFVSVDTATGTITTDPAAARRAVVSKDRCNACHLRITGHGQRTDPNACLFCHAAESTDWMYRPRDLRYVVGTTTITGSRQVLLWDPLEYPPNTAKAWTYWTADGIEERSIQLKTMIHRIHTGEREGVASLEGISPFLIQTGASRWAYLDDARYPNDLGNCEACHLPGTWAIEAVPATALPTYAHEEGSLVHLATWDGTGAVIAPATSAHSAAEATGAVTSACLSCHTSGAAKDHAAAKTVAGVETCVSCHGDSGAQSVRAVHALPSP